MKIKYSNVCSIRDAEVDFERGKLICIKGESNQGKSALFYSLVDGLINNKTFKNWINNDALKEDPKSVAKITIFDDEDNRFQIEAGTNHMYYRYNKAKYEKVGRKSIFEIIQRQIPGLLYDPDEQNQILNIVDEDSGMFPIDRSDPQIFKTYERLLSLSCTQDILRAIKLDVDEIDSKCADMLKTNQKSTEQLVKIDAVLDNVNKQTLTNIMNTLQNYLNNCSRLNSLYSSTKSISNYVDKVNESSVFNSEEFDTVRFSKLLELLIKSTTIQKYCSIAKIDIDKEEYFDLEKVSKINQSYNLALNINNDLASLNIEIDKDIKLLNDINSTLNSIKVCPLCGKPMEE